MSRNEIRIPDVIAIAEVRDGRSLATELPREMRRVRDEIMPSYLEIGDAGALALAMMRAELDRAALAACAGDLGAMMQSLAGLKGFTS